MISLSHHSSKPMRLDATPPCNVIVVSQSFPREAAVAAAERSFVDSVRLTGAKVLITGPTGNLGRPLALELAPSNEVWGLARFSDPEARGELEAAGVRCVEHDLGSDALPRLPDDFDRVFHAASLIPMASERDMARTLRVNTAATAQLLDHCREARTFVFCSTAGVYRHQPRPLVEEDDYGVDVPGYAISKIAAEQIVRYLSATRRIPCVILRIGALYGRDGGTGGATAPIERMIDGKEIWVSPQATQGVSLLWEDDAVALATAALSAGEVPALTLNFSGDEHVTVEEYCRFAGDLLGLTPRFRYTAEAYPANPLDTSRARKALGPCRTGWRQGMRTMLEHRYPHLVATAAGERQ